MAPKSAKLKKTTDVKVVSETDSKKGRSRTKNIVKQDEKPVDEEIEVNEKVNVSAGTKTKSKKKAAETDQQGDGDTPAPKKGRKKVVKDTEVDNKDIEENGQEEEKKDDEEVVKNGNGVKEDVQPAVNGKNKKQPAKKADTKSTRGRKQPKQEDDVEETGIEESAVEEKPKGKGKGLKVASKTKKVADNVEEQTISEPVPKGRKKAQPKAEKNPSPEPVEDAEDVEEVIEKKETKSRKGKKASVDDEPAAKKQKGNKKKDEKAKGNVMEEDNDEMLKEEEESEMKPAKGKRGAKKTVEPQDPEPEQTESTSKRRRKAENVEEEEPKKKAPLKNKAATDYDAIDFSNTSKTPQGKEWNFKISSWNVDGIRAWYTKGGLDYIQYEKPDILCLQEVKCSQDKMPDEVLNIPGYHAYWLCSEKDGYAGVGIYTTKLAMNVTYGLQDEELDSEGRIITAEYEQFYLICTYVPNAGRKLVTMPKRLQWNEEFRKYVKELDSKKPVIICGDMNVAHNEIDLANPKTNKKNAGFTEEERTGMTDLLSDGFVDTYRHFYPDKTGAYTFWTYMMNSRAKNVGWRLDYFIVSERLVPSICDNVIRDQVYGSDHCPLALYLHLTTADKPKE